MAVKNTEKAKNTDQIQSFKWAYLWMVTAFLAFSLFLRNANKHTSLKPLEKNVKTQMTWHVLLEQQQSQKRE